MGRFLLIGCAAILLTAGPRGGAAPEEEAPSERGAPGPPDSDLMRVRNIFRYAGEAMPPAPADRDSFDPGGAQSSAAPAPAPGARLVGLVERAEHFVAALVLDGEVMVLGAGESATGFTVLEVTEEGVRLLTPEGEEQILTLP